MAEDCARLDHRVNTDMDVTSPDPSLPGGHSGCLERSCDGASSESVAADGLEDYHPGHGTIVCVPYAPPEVSIGELLKVARRWALWRRVPSQEIDDCATECVVIALGICSSAYHWPEFMRPWYDQICSRCADRFRYQAHRIAEHEVALGAPGEFPVGALADTAPDENPDARLITLHRQWALTRLATGVGPDAWALLVRHHVRGEPLVAIAASLGISEQAAADRLKRARRRLRIYAARRGIEAEDL